MPKNKRQKRQRIRFPWRALFLISLGFCLPLAVYVGYLDRVVVSQFEGKRFSLPARVYARPLELHADKVITLQQLSFELQQLNYARTAQLTAPGQFKSSSQRFSIFVRPFIFWDGEQRAQQIHVGFRGNRITTISDANTGDIIDLVRLDPIRIGGIYPNQGEDRTLVRLEQVPRFLVDALVATEDKRFYKHYGVDPKAVLRAFTTLFTGQRVQGGSTLTQQLVKNFYLTQERTIRRKLKEMIMAVLLELHYEKDEILETYLNEVYFGQDRNRAIHGFALASQFYFSRNIEHIALDQAAILVGLLKGPAYYNPRKHPKRAKKRRDIVLKALADQHYIDTKTYTTATQSNIAISKLPDRGQSRYPAFMDLVIRQLKRDYRESDLRSEGLRIFTSLDPFTQNIAETALTQKLSRLEKDRGLTTGHLQGSVVIAKIPDGEVAAVVGDRKPRYQGFNRALDASRQIGSLIKPAIYLTALSQPQNYHLATPLNDDAFTWQENGIEDWQPQNYDKKFHGEVPLWLALAKSYNVSAARLGAELGINNVMNTVHRLGIDKSLPNYASGLLGTVHLSPYEVTQMYHTIANGGFHTPFRAIRDVTTTDGAPLNRYNLNVTPAVAAEPNYLLVKGLQEVVQRGTAASLKHLVPKSLNAAGKTGTTDNLRDSWFAGFTGDKVAVVWIGNDKNKSVQLTGASGALKVWGEIIRQLPSQAVNIPTPEAIEYLGVDNKTGLLSSQNCHNTHVLPFHQDSVTERSNYCGRKSTNRIKSWFKGIFSR